MQPSAAACANCPRLPGPASKESGACVHCGASTTGAPPEEAVDGRPADLVSAVSPTWEAPPWLADPNWGAELDPSAAVDDGVTEITEEDLAGDVPVWGSTDIKASGEPGEEKKRDPRRRTRLAVGLGAATVVVLSLVGYQL